MRATAWQAGKVPALAAVLIALMLWLSGAFIHKIRADTPITLDPIFSGLAWSLIFGLLVSTLFTLVVVPMIYFVAYGNISPCPTDARSSS